MIPLQFFEPPRTALLEALAWTVRIYWSIDMRPESSALRYMKTWLPFDMLVVGLDWSELVGGFQEFAIARVGKMFKTVRMLRMIRILKIMKTARAPEALKSYTY